MKGTLIVYKGLGQFMRQARERKNISLESAAMILGFNNLQYLSRCELGKDNFPAHNLKRAMDLYGVSAADIVEVSAADFSSSLFSFLNKNH